ncbi:hypothetical protein GHA01_00810 [Novacetimonas hansenii]|uniref:Uncharacterized protein n=1 Tax=Novacetimonas hansenii TaxID=436 RepID=A0ABQ0SAI5_NOVHA|nr:hypothetical protein Gaha_0089_011 [Novacetimonas hansenii JCM 7643]GEC62232.1 hypothetical protein GHA01_00810 [Novacetimonas hansenii]
MQGAVTFLDTIDVDDKARRRRGLLSQITGDFGSHRTQIPSVLLSGCKYGVLNKRTDVAKRSNGPATSEGPKQQAPIARTLDVVA